MKTAFIQGIGGVGEALAWELLNTHRQDYDLLILAARNPESISGELVSHPKVKALHWDISKPEEQKQSQQYLQSMHLDLQLVINSQGILHHDETSAPEPSSSTALIKPERRIEALDAAAMLYVYEVNAVVPMITIQTLWPILRKSSQVWVINISAKVGSIADNRLGGWYSYRSSKAALNMLTKTLALEMKQRRINGGTLAIHPGTVATQLSDPFTDKTKDNRISPQQSAAAIVNIVKNRSFDESGTFWSWDGKELPW